MPVKLYFGPGQIENIDSIVSNDLNAANPVFITDKGVIQAGLMDGITQKFDRIKLFDDIEANPKSDTINRLAEQIREIQPDLIIGIGGGSSLDAGKALALLTTNEGEIEEYAKGIQVDGNDR